jgi:superfamily II DNA or RNA helicase
VNNEEQRKRLLEKIERVDLQISLLKELKEKLTTSLDDPGKIIPSPVDLTGFKDPLERQDILESSSINDKIDLFRSLFRGRDDVYARFWISRKTGKSGYSPVCKNEWVPKVCKKPIMKCSECPNRELVPLDDEIIRKHLAGIYIVGIYPMLQDETCYFLAVDFDKEDWVDNVFTFKEICMQEGIPVAIERSRSGNGAHAWIFFKENVPAILARRMGSFLITKTMSKRYKLSMKNYDRLFPNQDTLPKGGFGSLIALPFQKEAAKQGNSVFIDESCNPYRNQWKLLSTLQKMSFCDVERFSKEASRTGQIIGVRMSPVDENDPPWMRLPSGRRRYKSVIKDLPERVELVIANRIYIKTDNIPSVLLNQIKQLAAFQNPEFYKRQNMRLSTFLTPRVISCSEILDSYLSIPRGCLDDVSCLLSEYGIKVNIKDERTMGKKTKFKFYGELNKEQKAASRKILKNEIGILVAPSGLGKTVIAIAAIAKRKTNTLILVHRKPLMEQWRLQLSSFLGINLKDIGQIGAGKNKSNGILDIAMIQSMERKGVVDDRIIDYGFVIADECHHISAVSFERVLMQAKAKYILGLTATPYRKDGHQPIIHMQCGPIRYQKKLKDITQKISEYLVIPRMTEFTCEWDEESNIYDLWPKLINDGKRNQLIVDDILQAVHKGRFPIILTERREHLKILTQMLEDKIEHLIVLCGGIKQKRRKEILEELFNSTSKKTKAILATGTYIGEGFDSPKLDTLFITMPISFKGRVVQYAGRLHRRHKDKTDVRIYDYIDENIPVLRRMYEKRLRTYKVMGYKSS